MRKISFLRAAIMVLVLLHTTVVAAENPGANIIKVNVSDSVLTVNVSYPTEYDGRSNVYIVPNENLNDAISGDMSSAVFVGEKELTLRAADYKFLMPSGIENGVYVAVSGESSLNNDIGLRSRKFRYNSDTGAVSARLNALNTASSFKQKLLDGASDAWYIDTSDSAWTGNESVVLSIMQSMKGTGFISSFAVEDAFALACDFADIAGVSNDKILANFLYQTDILGCDTSNEDFIKYTDSVVEKFKSLAMTDIPQNNAEIQTLYRTACGLACLSNTNRTHSISDLQKYNDVFNLNFSGDYTKIDSFELAKVFENKNYTTVKQVQDDFTNKIEALLEAETSGNGGFSGGNLGGSGGGGGTTNLFEGVGDELINEMNSATKIFYDVEDTHWASEYIKFVYENGIMTGDTEGTFRPEAQITREEWAKVVLETFAIDTEDAVCEFSDVNEKEWFYPYVARAYELGVVNGYDEKIFGIGHSLTRQDAVTMLHRITAMARDIRDISLSELTFSDVKEIGDYALEPVKIFVSLNVINGYEDGRFVPCGNITRAEAAKIICSLLQELE